MLVDKATVVAVAALAVELGVDLGRLMSSA